MSSAADRVVLTAAANFPRYSAQSAVISSLDRCHLLHREHWSPAQGCTAFTAVLPVSTGLMESLDCCGKMVGQFSCSGGIVMLVEICCFALAVSGVVDMFMLSVECFFCRAAECKQPGKALVCLDELQGPVWGSVHCCLQLVFHFLAT